MNKPNASLYWLIGAAFLFFLLGKGLEIYFDDHRLIKRHHSTIQSYLNEQESAIEDLLNNEDFIAQSYHTVKEPINFFEELEHPFNLCLYKDQELVAWSNNIAFPNEEILTKLEQQNPLFEKLSNGYYRIAKHEINQKGYASELAISLIPIKWDYISSLKHLKSHFEPTGKQIPSYTDISLTPTDFPIVDTKGNTICYLEKDNSVGPTGIQDKDILYLILFFYVLSWFFIGYLLNNFALDLNLKYKAWAGSSFLLFSVFGLRYLSLLLGWTDRFSNLKIFQRSFLEADFSIGDLLINTILLLWVVIFFHRQSRSKTITTDQPKSVRFMLTTMNYLSLVLALLLLISVFKSLVLSSGFSFDFKNVFNLEPYSVAAVMGIILLIFTLFIFCHRMMLAIRQILLARHMRLYALGVATFISLPIIYFIDLRIAPQYVALITFIFILTYDIFVDFENPGLIWLVVWIIFFTGFSSGLLNKYNYDREILEEQKLAKALAMEKDTFALQAIHNLKNHLESDLKLSEDFELSKIAPQIEKIIFKENYLYNNYTYSFFPAKDSLSTTEVDSLSKRFRSSLSLESKDIYIRPSAKGHTAYTIDLSAVMNRPLLLNFDKAGAKKATVYSEILSDRPYRNLRGLEEYEYAIYKDWEVVDSDGIEENRVSPVFDSIPKLPVTGDFIRRPFRSNDDFLYNHDDVTYVLLSKEKNGFFHPASLFSYIFSLLTLTVLLFALINRRLKILPHNLNFDVGKKPSLKNRIQISTIILTLISFVIIAFISFLFLRNNWIDYHDNRLKRKITSVQLDSENWLHYMDNSIELLQQRVQQLAVTHRIDVNLFDLEGNLISSSQEDIFSQGILPRKMNASAIFELGILKGKDYFQTEDRIGDELFKTAFVPLQNTIGEKVAYLEVPYYSKQRSLEDEISDFMGRLLNVYVFLLFIAGIFSVLVANSITKPLTVIGEKLQEVKVGKPNMPLNWETNDEIGSLVTEYNQMIKKLEESADLLAKSEREGAWREMAKQVAHEIKNPLTPMKLSIQYLNHAYQSNPDNIDGLMGRVSKTLIEQIDNLAHIANEFSNFAKMPRANNQEFVVNDLVSSVHELFKKQDGCDVLLSLPDASFTVFADKKQLLQVLNNLIKNATEAIPDHRRGNIEVSLFERDKVAVIQVSDNGVGIPEEMKKKVFVPNFTTKNSGTGLGLAISKNIIESVNGKIYYDTVPNVGTDFYVELPIERIEELEPA